MRPRLSISGLSILLALLLVLWEVYFFGFAGDRLFGDLEGKLGWFTPDRLGSNIAWLIWAYLSYQLISIRFRCHGQVTVSSASSTAWHPWCRSPSYLAGIIFSVPGIDGKPRCF
jgi:hypothetical protein